MNDQPSTPERLAQAAHALPPGVSAWPPGHRLGGFEFRGVVAVRSTSIVYRGWDHGLEVPVALKEYLPAALARRGPYGDIGPAEPAQAELFEHGLRAFIDEGRRLARCDHPSIARVLHLLPAHGGACLVMPWYAGRPLAELRREMSGPPDEPALRALLDALLAALHEWHRVNGVHGGLHPAGVLLLDDDRPLLLGPGYAERAIALGGPAMAALEPGFAAPEIDEDPARIGSWSDVFALAQLARFAITGLLPPPAGRTTEPLAAVVERLFFDHPSARYGPALLATLDAAVSPDIAARPQSIVEFAAWLANGPPRRSATARAEPAIDVELDLPAPEPAPVPAPAAAPAAARPGPRGRLGRGATNPGHTPDWSRWPEETPPAGAAPAAGAAASTPERVAAARHGARRDPPLVPFQFEPATTPGPMPARPAADEEPDAATVDLIQRVIETLPPAPPRRDGAAREPAAPPATPPAPTARTLPLEPPPRDSVMRWMLAALGLAAALGLGLWWHETRGPDARPATLQAQPAAAAPVAPASQPVLAEPAEPAAPPPVAVETPPVVPADPAPPPAAPPPREEFLDPPPRAAGPATPRAACGERSGFALYRCFQQQCDRAAWARHAQCVEFRATDRVPG